MGMRQWIGRVIKAGYDALPVAFEVKMRWKSALFTAFPSWFERTVSYQRWIAFGRAAPVPLPPAANAAVNGQAPAVAYRHAVAVAQGACSLEFVPYRPQRPLGRPRAKLIAFYLPQFHPFAENDEWWGRGFTEWTNVSKAQPQFIGHHQPRLPGELGFYDLRVPEVQRRQVELAREYGVHGFCFHYYWFAGRRLLERPLDSFLQSDIDFPFCICWANENWTRRWDGRDQDILIGQEHSAENDLDFIADLAPLLRDRRYIHVDGRPLVIVYRPSLLPDPAATTKRWRAWCRDNGIGDIFLAMVQFDVHDPLLYGFDSALEFPPHKLAAGLPHIHDRLEFIGPEHRGYVVDYDAVVDRALERPAPHYPLSPGVFPSWDNEARKPCAGYTFANASPARYRRWLDAAIDFARAHPVGGEPLVFINAWNEWAEGAYLEPDRWHGYANLQATRDAVEAKTDGGGSPQRSGIVLVSHDAHPHGAQYLALHIARELHEGFGCDVDVILLGGGTLAGEFGRHGTVHDASAFTQAQMDDLAMRLRTAGRRVAIANTTVAGQFVAALSHAGLKVVSLIHELPGLIRDFGIGGHARSIAEHAHRIVFAAPQVRDGFLQVAPNTRQEQLVLRPQGLFVRNPYRWTTDADAARAQLRQRLGLPADSRIVLSVGYGDRRKGLDLLGEMVARLLVYRDDVHCVWVGHYDTALMEAARARLRKLGREDRLHANGIDFDTALYYAGADVYVLASREDPFPNVVLESLSVGLPVVAFAGTGGAEDLLKLGAGRLVPAFDVDALADQVADLIATPAARERCGSIGRQLIAERFGFRQYVFDLLGLLDAAPPKVSVVVPNYNYAHLLRDRLFSIVQQQVPLYEIIVLDDASSDDSLRVLNELRDELGIDISVHPSATNSGSVFRQWSRGVELAKGDYVWIAEADDLSAPDFLQTVLESMVADPDVVMSYCDSRQIDDAGCVLADSYDYYTRSVSAERWGRAYIREGIEEIRHALAVKNTIPNVSAVVFRREPLLEVLRQNLEQIAQCRIAGDWLVYVHLLARGRIAYDPGALNIHRRHSGSVTSAGNRVSHLREVLAVQDLIRARYSVDASVERLAREYAQTLYEQFGLCSDGVPSVESFRSTSSEPNPDVAG